MVQSLNTSMLISKKNEVYIVLKDVEPSTAAEVNDFFTFVVNSEFSNLFKSDSFICNYLF